MLYYTYYFGLSKFRLISFEKRVKQDYLYSVIPECCVVKISTQWYNGVSPKL